MVSTRVVLLGPQRLVPTLNVAMESLGVRGRIAAVTAGWEEREQEDRELVDHLGGRVVNLRVWGRCEGIYARDPELFQAMRERRELLRRAQELYRLRLSHALDAARTLLGRASQANGEGDALLESECTAAIEDVRRLDAEHHERLRSVHADFDRTWRPLERATVAAERAELASLLAHCSALCIAGGDVRVLLGRLRLLDLVGAWTAGPIVAWSAGAMVLGQRVILFHDSPPQGEGNAEVFETGLGRVRDIVPLPHARRRLRLDDRERVSLFARRFGPDLCVALDERTRVDYENGGWSGAAGTMALAADGTLAEVGAG
jgi:hypothetical protein